MKEYQKELKTSFSELLISNIMKKVIVRINNQDFKNVSRWYHLRKNKKIFYNKIMLIFIFRTESDLGEICEIRDKSNQERNIVN
jgi:hypothetical protein